MAPARLCKDVFTFTTQGATPVTETLTRTITNAFTGHSAGAETLTVWVDVGIQASLASSGELGIDVVVTGS